MKSIFILLALMIPLLLKAQNFSTKTGTAKFHSDAPLEDIDAVTNQMVGVLNTETGDLTFALLIKSFQFKKALMQEHFNENYLESDKYPKAVFKGKIIDHDPITLKKNGRLNIKVKGTLNLHGVTEEISTDATLVINDDNIQGTAKFSVMPEDYRIKIPHTVRNNIAKIIEVTIQVILKPLE